MKMIPSLPAMFAGLLSVASAIPIFMIWHTLLVVATPSQLTIAEAVNSQLQYVFSVENPARWAFVWFAILPFLCLGIGGAYLLKLASSRKAAMLLLTFTCILSLAVLAFNTWDLAVFTALPAYWGWQCVRDAPPTIRAAT